MPVDIPTINVIDMRLCIHSTKFHDETMTNPFLSHPVPEEFPAGLDVNVLDSRPRDPACAHHGRLGIWSKYSEVLQIG